MFEGGTVADKRCPPGACVCGDGGESKLARFLELVSSPQDKWSPYRAWSAKDDGGFGGKKTVANLAAIHGDTLVTPCSF